VEKDNTAYHNCLGAIYKEKFCEYFCYLACYYFLQDKPKFLCLVDKNECQGQGLNKHSTGSKDTHPIEKKKAKQLRKVEETAEHIGATLGIMVKKV